MKLSGKRIRRISIVCLTAVCSILILCAGCARNAIQKNLRQGGYLESWSEEDGRVLSGLTYGKEASNQYDLYLPKNLDPKADAPLLLLIHGGSWTEGSRNDVAYACKYYAKQGCITATMDYSLVSDRNDVTIKTMLDEITACIAALKQRLAKEGYSAPKLAVGGFSAGGHLALLYAYSRASESAVPVAFVFDKVGPVSFHREFWGDRIAAMLIGYGARVKVDPKKLDTPEMKAAADALSPLHFISEKSVPTVFAYGGRDDLVRAIHRDELAKALEQHHVPNVRVDFPNSNHMLWDDPDSTEAFRAAVLKYCDEYMNRKPPAGKKEETKPAEPKEEAKPAGPEKEKQAGQKDEAK
ncbi:MAG: alpha/beta hydrolase [Lentisphaeria bacterium]|nr:alpha/beta hydrolase [Lentisphaeria bacterium]